MSEQGTPVFVLLVLTYDGWGDLLGVFRSKEAAEREIDHVGNTTLKGKRLKRPAPVVPDRWGVYLHRYQIVEDVLR